jgi:hypothetical protein
MLHTLLVTQTKMTIFRPFIILVHVHFVDAVINLKHNTYMKTLVVRVYKPCVILLCKEYYNWILSISYHRFITPDKRNLCQTLY